MKNLAGKEYTAKDKTVSKMTREGLTEENLRDGSVKEVSQRSRGRPPESGSESSFIKDKAEKTGESSGKSQKRKDSADEKILGFPAGIY